MRDQSHRPLHFSFEGLSSHLAMGLSELNYDMGMTRSEEGEERDAKKQNLVPFVDAPPYFAFPRQQPANLAILVNKRLT